MQQQQSTYDQYIAAWLVANGIPVLGTFFDGGLTRFDFPDNDQVAQLIYDYRYSSPLLPAREAFHALRTVQGLIKKARVTA